MSEFQYYEFQAIDRPLDRAARDALRRISSRARITSHSLTNTYQWGDFKGEPRRLMAQWFDLFVYWANWGSRTAMLRLPRRALDLADVRPYAVKDVLEAWSAGEFTIVAVFGERDDAEYLEDEGHDEADDYEEADDYDDIGRSAPFAALRADLLVGDRRCLYLGWLLGVQGGYVEDAANAPPRPAGTEAPSGALAAFAEFFRIDQDLLDAALARENGCAAGELRAAAEARRAERARLAAARRAAEEKRRAQAERRPREAHLAQLAARGDSVWSEIEALAEAKLPAQYDQAIVLLKDLEHLADRGDGMERFHERLEAFRERHRRKPTLMRRLEGAGLVRPAR